MNGFAPSGVTESRVIFPSVAIHPRIAQTAAGPLEFDFSEGQGPVVLSVHGGIGGCDQARIMAAWLDPARFRILSPSRPGYLGTPLETGRTMEQQADAFAALLDALGINKALVMGASAGGPPAYWFAIRHPDRVAGLLMIDGVSGFYDIPETAGPIAQAIFLSDLGQKILHKIGQWRPDIVLQSLFQAESLFTKDQIKKQIEYVMADKRLLEFVQAFTATMSPYRLRKQGTENDLEQFRQYVHLPVEQIRCPTLIMHGTHDADVKLYDSVYAYEHISNAQRFWIEDGSHLGFWLSPNAVAAQQAAVNFFDACID